MKKEVSPIGVNHGGTGDASLQNLKYTVSVILPPDFDIFNQFWRLNGVMPCQPTIKSLDNPALY